MSGRRRAMYIAQAQRTSRAGDATMTAAVRCAIYTRVSTDAGLEQDFNSLDAQRESAEAYIKSQAHEGWRLVRERFDDGGYSGGSMERPALQNLLDRVRERRIDVIVVYKVDRLTRSLADFAKLVEAFDAHGVAFVSVTQSFNTTTSMGRLTLNVLLSFAQFEREVTGERIRDKIAASKKKGLWMGGVVPLGYRCEARKLHVDEEEAAIVRMIFDLYLKLGSVRALQRELRRRDVRTRVRTLATGKTVGGVHLTSGPLAHHPEQSPLSRGDQSSRAILAWRARGDHGRGDIRQSSGESRRAARSTLRPTEIQRVAHGQVRSTRPAND